MRGIYPCVVCRREAIFCTCREQERAYQVGQKLAGKAEKPKRKRLNTRAEYVEDARRFVREVYEAAEGSMPSDKDIDSAARKIGRYMHAVQGLRLARLEEKKGASRAR